MSAEEYDYDSATGEVIERAPRPAVGAGMAPQQRAEVEQIGMVPLNIAALDDEQIAAQFPSPLQMHHALQVARERLTHAPAAMDGLRHDLRAAERAYRLAFAHAYVDADGAEHLRRQAALLDPRVVEAQDAKDLAWIKLEYGKELKAALFEDIGLLRSMNANLRTEAGR